MAHTTRYGTTHAGHEIELDFDRSKIVLNQARLLVDSGMMGELRRARLRGSDGSWTDLTERGGGG